MFADAVPKEDFNQLKTDLAEQKKRCEELSLEKAWLEEELKRKSQDLESAEHKCEEREETITTLQDDLNDLCKGDEILDKELLRKQYSFPFRHTIPKKDHSPPFLNHCRTIWLSTFHH